MAIFFPVLNSVLSRMQPGERRVARRLEAALEDDYLCWFDIPVGNKNNHPDFTLLHPGRGLLILEVKDWAAETIRGGDKSSFQILTPNGMKTVPNPLEQARQYAYTVVNLLARDPQLRQRGTEYEGRLLMPYGYGVVFSNLTRQQVTRMQLDRVVDERLILCKDDLSHTLSAEYFQEKLWNMFNYQFGGLMTQPQIDRVRAHLWPEICVQPLIGDLLSARNEASDESAEAALPDVIKVMDYQQEQLARSLGDGHRVIHGVAGSGKTMILGFRCLHLARLLHKPTLVLCFNVTLAARLRSYFAGHGIDDKVHVYHFHAWCAQQLRSFNVDVPEGEAPIFERQVAAVIAGVEKGRVPRAQYGAVLIDEAHDFHPDWLRLVTGMVDPETNSLLLLYDDAQSIYQKAKLGFSLSSVGIQARGRTRVLKLNYRNTRQILQFAYAFAQAYVKEHDADEDQIPLVKPEAGGSEGSPPVLREFKSREEESSFIVKCLAHWHANGRPWRDIGLVYRNYSTGARLARALEKASIPFLLTHDKASKASYDPTQERVSLLTMHSSKGLEFPIVVVAGVGDGPIKEDELEIEARLLYVAMTRAMESLLITTCSTNALTGQLAVASKAVASTG